MMLYCTTRKLRYGLLALRLQPLQATVFEHGADPQFGALLGRLLAEYRSSRERCAMPVKSRPFVHAKKRRN